MSEPEQYTVFDTAFGVCGVRWSESGVTRFALPQADGYKTEERVKATVQDCRCDDAPPAIAHLIAEIQRYFAGEEIDFSDVAIDVKDRNAFERSIYAAARAIGFGYTATYGELARRAGAPRLTRETGQALGRNPVPLIVPCHRIVAADGKLGGFSAPGGNATKERMLALEGSRLPLAL
jgi:methylated-DNA-[protein]-cysteine S-methyltransferase